ncbi:MAG: MFS transporter [Patescibacteria group bacterium]|nr:MFS transporter [Patescibacteria group bacterium]
MSFFPKIEKITRDIAISNFLLMFGYKLFSLYLPLFLVAKNFSILQIGYTNFLIYLPIALLAPIIGFLNHKVNPAILVTIGVIGYGIYALGMIIFPNLFTFYLFQIILGISAALFFVSSRAILMGSKLENPDTAFAWFYSSPSYADAIAPVVGAFFIWKFDFIGVFILSLILQFLNAIFCFFQLRNQTKHLTETITVKESNQNYLKVIQIISWKNIFPFILISFFVLILAGFNNTFFVLFLKNFGWSQNQILAFNSIISLIFLPISLWIIKQVAKFPSKINICHGSQIVGVFSILLGGLASILNFYLAFFIIIGKYIGGLMTGSGRSGLLTTKLKKFPEESAAVDTIFSPLATAFGALIGGLLIPILGYPLIFIFGGVLIFFFGFFGKLAKNRHLI